MDIQQQYEKGIAALKRRNYGFAVLLFQQILEEQPNFNQARKSLREAGKKKFLDAGGSGMVKVSAFFKGFGSFMSAVMSKGGSPEKAVIAAERYLGNDPTNKAMLGVLAKASESAGYNEAAVMAYEALIEYHPEEVQALLDLGQLLVELGKPGEAQVYFERARKKRPQDANIERIIRDVQAVATMSKGYEKSESFRDNIKGGEEEARQRDKEQQTIRSSDDLDEAIERQIQKVNDNPDDHRLLLQLGDFYKRKNDFANGLKTYQKAKEIDPSDPNIDLKVGDLTIKEYEVKIAAENDAAAKKALQKEKLQYMLKEYQRRIKAQPTHQPYYFELGKLYLRVGKYDDAIAQFQTSVKSPKLKNQSLNFLGLGFMNNKMYDLAETQLKNALENLPSMTDLKKEVLYNLGMVYEKGGKKADALSTYSEIYQEDISYKDVADRIKAVRGE